MTDFHEVSDHLFDKLNTDKLKPIQAVPTPFPIWNKCCRDEGGGKGLARGWHIIVAGKTGLGKSVLGLNLAAHAFKAGEKVWYLTLEMSQAQLVTRMMSIVSDIDIRRLEHGPEYSEADAATVKTLWGEYAKKGGGVWVPSKPLQSLDDVEESIHTAVETVGCKYLITDYIQRAWVKSASTLLEQVMLTSNTIQRLAETYGLVSVVLSQFNRATSSTKDSPQSQGLMGGSPLENDAHQVILLDHSTYERNEARRATCNLILDKNRHGPTGDIPVVWDYRSLRVTEEQKIEVAA